jgi:DNA-binding transcriptional MerR regulator/CheY-like chemotaxis protein
VNRSAAYLSPAEAARQLGVSAKALRLYEERGFVSPGRTQAGWRAYGPADMQRAREIVALRALGLSLAQVGRVLAGEAADGLEATLAAHQSQLESRLHETSAAIQRVRDLRRRITAGDHPGAGDLAALQAHATGIVTAFDLPWPWGGERFELLALKPITYLTGPLFSGKTKLAQCIANAVPGAVFIGLDRAAIAALAPDEAQVSQILSWLLEDGATATDALRQVAIALAAPGPSLLVFDLVEQGLDEATQLALIACLRRRGDGATPVILMTRSNAILDLASVGAGEAILFCPANHSPPVYVAPYPGAPGYEALASCLASPDVRARSEGVVAMRTGAA